MKLFTIGMKGITIIQLRCEVEAVNGLVSVADCKKAAPWDSARISRGFADRYIEPKEIVVALSTRNVVVVCLCYDYADCGRNAIAVKAGIEIIHLYPISSWEELLKIPF